MYDPKPKSSTAPRFQVFVTRKSTYHLVADENTSGGYICVAICNTRNGTYRVHAAIGRKLEYCVASPLEVLRNVDPKVGHCLKFADCSFITSQIIEIRPATDEEIVSYKVPSF